MLDLALELGQAAAAALRQAFPDSTAIPTELNVQTASRPEFGDLQIAACLQLGKPLGKKPRELAQLVADRLGGHPALQKVEVAGAGYVNLYLGSAYIEQRLAAVASDPHHGLRQRFSGQRVIVDYSSPNIAKPMHIGHIRSTIIGDALARVMRAVGYSVVADNHLGDWGTQFGKLIVAYRRWLDPVAYAATPIAELVRLYQKFVTEEKQEAQALGLKKPDRKVEAAEAAEAGPGEPGDEDAEAGEVDATPLLKEARAELAKLQGGDPENLRLWREFVSVSMREFERTYARLGVKFDVQLGESFYHPRLGALVEELLARGIAEHSRGAVICPIEGEPAPLLVRKADGSFLYGTSDIATIEHRIKEWNPSRILYVVGAPQMLHFRQVFAVARKLGAGCSLEHIVFGSMRFRDQSGNFVTGSTRLGNVPLLDEFIDAAIERARAVAKGKNAELEAEDLEEVARVVGIGAIKYNDLCRDRQSDINFDLDKALALEGNTAPYIQYAYARLRSIARRAEAEGATMATSPRIAMPAERELARRLLDYDVAVERVAETARPHSLCEYLYELAGAVSTFYNEVPVLKATPEERAARLWLLDLTARTLRHGLLLLGIEVPERM
jgi:arginyl-tRNA synthetase